MSMAKKAMCVIGAGMAFIGNGLAYYFNTATHEETIGPVVYEVLTYDTDHVTGAIALAVIGTFILLVGALAKD
ncbi:MAG: hypothetical protein LLG21_07560 [Euryarchaeota archaeon]|jgi:hypothetical protein|nr:hypothetical protein [Euryarchaeota archaeon]HPD08371.1 hypothetical protein [Methanomassiliicoccales archaeon]HQM66923.1 hypothetical protein [Methanomassiliicoccales archaeon]HRU11350.1 hypothetical protein [Methanomassiliicoccales archaeon]